LIENYESLKILNSSIETSALEALEKALEIEKPYKLALEQIDKMSPLRVLGEQFEAKIDRHEEKVDEMKEVIKSISNLSELMKDELFDDIFLTDSYDDIKELVYKLLDEKKLEQVFDENVDKLVLVKVEQ